MSAQHSCVEMAQVIGSRGLTFVRCGSAADAVRLPCPAGRPDAIGGPYCAEHGGIERAEREARASWDFVAPATVGSSADVHRAGTEVLRTPERYIVVRQLSEAQGGAWVAALGLGSLMSPVENPAAVPSRRGGARHRRSGGRPSGTQGFRELEDALAAARALWAQRLAARVEAIRVARGGTLEWGLPVEPAAEPIVIVLEQGDQRSGWDVALSLPRQAPPGFAVLSGLRPSGEIA